MFNVRSREKPCSSVGDHVITMISVWYLSSDRSDLGEHHSQRSDHFVDSPATSFSANIHWQCGYLGNLHLGFRPFHAINWSNRLANQRHAKRHRFPSQCISAIESRARLINGRETLYYKGSSAYNADSYVRVAFLCRSRLNNINNPHHVAKYHYQSL